MADNLFNPNISTQDPKDFTSASKGVDVDTRGRSGVGSLLQQGGELFGLAVKAADTVITESIDSLLRPKIDQAQDEFGVGAAATVAQPAAKDVPPAEIDKAVKFMERNAEAVRQGNMNMSSYWARLETASRELRTRFPGHRDYIDEKISNITGSKPANAIVRTLHQEAQSAKEARDKTADREASFIYSNFHYLPPEMQQGWKAGRTSNDQVIIAIGQMKGVEQQAQTQSAILNAKMKAGDFKDAEAYKFLEASLMDANQIHKTTLSDSLGKSLKDVDTFISDVASGKRVPTPEEKTNMNLFLMGAKKNAEQALRKHAQAYFQAMPDFKPDMKKVEEMIQSNLKEYDSYAETLTGNAKGVSIVAADRDLADAMKENERVKALRIPIVRASAAVRQELGDQAYLALMSTGNLKSSTERIVHDFILGNMISPGGRGSNTPGSPTQSVLSVIQSARDSFGVSTPAAEVQAIRSAATIMTDPKTDPAKQAFLIESFFGTGNRRMLNAVLPGNRMEVYETMTSGTVHDTLAKLKDTRPELWNTYKSYVSDNLNIDGVKTLNTLASFESRSDNKYFNIQYANGQFYVVRDTSVQPDQYQVGQMKSYEMATRNLARNLNAHIAPVKRIAETEGTDPDVQVYNWLKLVGMERMAPNPNITTKGPTVTAPVMPLTGTENSNLDINYIGGIDAIKKDITLTGRESTNVIDQRGMLNAGEGLAASGAVAPKPQEVFRTIKELDPTLGAGMDSLIERIREAEKAKQADVAKRLREQLGQEFTDYIFGK